MISLGSGALRAPLLNLFLQRSALRSAAGMYLKLKSEFIFAGVLNKVLNLLFKKDASLLD
jgi:hypothetical protein